MDDLLDLLGRLRYGVTTNEKEGIAAAGSLPGAPHDSSLYKDSANRYAAGYLFTKEHPTIAPSMIPAVNILRGLFGDSPEIMAQAVAGMNRARQGGK
jgi:hypothetical protein